MRTRLLPLGLLALSLQAQRTSVLFIGNSYTYVNDLPNTFRQLALSLGDTVDIAMSAPGGFSFSQHAAYAPTLDAIASRPWDYVVLQEQSQMPAFPNPATTLFYATALADQIEANDECTWPVFYMTWGRENGDADNCAGWPPVCTYAGMQALLRERYLQMGVDNDGYVAPVGVAWKRVRETQPGIGLYNGDGSHPSLAGTYLAACVFYSTLFRESTVGAAYTASLPTSIATTLQGIASSMVLDSAATWNLDVPNGTDATITGSTSDGAYAITFHHPGQGTHLWTCSDGQSSTDAEPTFTLPGPGVYTFTHAYTDPCGNSDTVSWSMEVLPVGLSEDPHAPSPLLMAAGPGLLELTGGTSGAELTLMDLQGRTLRTHRLSGERDRIPCPAGPYLWTMRTLAGAQWTGKVWVP